MTRTHGTQWQIKAEMRLGGPGQEQIVFDTEAVDHALTSAREEAGTKGGVAVVRRALTIYVYVDYTLPPGETREFSSLEAYHQYLVEAAQS